MSNLVELLFIGLSVALTHFVGMNLYFSQRNLNQHFLMLHETKPLQLLHIVISSSIDLVYYSAK